MGAGVKIVVDAVDKTKKGLTAPIKNVKDLGKAVKNLAPAFAAAATAATAAFAAMARSQINVFDQTAKLAAKLGVSTEMLSTMTHASHLTGTSLDGLRNAFKTLGQRAVDSTRGLKSVNDDFNALGVNVLDASGKMKTTEVLFLEIADAISGMEDGLEKAGIASKLMGRQGLELVPLLNQGADGIKRMQEEARALGLEIDGNTAAQAEKFNDDIVRMKGLATGMARTFLSETLPALIGVTDSLVKAGIQSGVFQGAAQTMADTLLAVGRAASGVVAIFKLLGGITASVAASIVQVFSGIANVVETALSGMDKAISKLSAAMENLAIGNFRRAGALIAEAGDEMGKGFEGVPDEAKKQFEILGKVQEDAVKRAKEDAKAIFDAFAGNDQSARGGQGGTLASAQNLPGIGDPAEATLQAQSFIDKIQGKFNQLTMTKIELARLERDERLKMAEQLIADTQKRAEVEGQIEKIFTDAKIAGIEEELAKRVEAQAFIDELKSKARLIDAEQREVDIANADADLARTIERAEQIAETEAQLREMKEAAEAVHQAKLVKIEKESAKNKMMMQNAVAQGYADSLGKMSQAAGTFFGQESAAFKAFAIAEAIINTYRGANKALAEHTWPLNLVAAGAVIASGLANVATISGVAHGGISEVPSDQTFLLKKGERVLSPDQNSDFTEAMQGGGGFGGGDFHLTIELDGQALWDAMGKASRDGRLELAPRAIA